MLLGYYENAEQAFFWRYLRPGDTFVDCGAHFGLFSMLAAHAMDGNGTILSIEPNSSTQKLLSENLSVHSNGFGRLVNAAVSDFEGEAAFYVNNHGAAQGSLVGSEHQPISVPVTTLDQLIKAHNFSRIDLLKIDIEGAELSALHGAKDALARKAIKTMVIEFTPDNLKKAGTSREEIIDYLASFGAEVFDLSPSGDTLIPYSPERDHDYKNVVATFDKASVLRRLQSSSPKVERICSDLAERAKTKETVKQVQYIKWMAEQKWILENKLTDAESQRKDLEQDIAFATGQLETQRNSHREIHKRMLDAVIQKELEEHSKELALRRYETIESLFVSNAYYESARHLKEAEERQRGLKAALETLKIENKKVEEVRQRLEAVLETLMKAKVVRIGQWLGVVANPRV